MCVSVPCGRETAELGSWQKVEVISEIGQSRLLHWAVLPGVSGFARGSQAEGVGWGAREVSGVRARPRPSAGGREMGWRRRGCNSPPLAGYHRVVDVVVQGGLGRTGGQSRIIARAQRRRASFCIISLLLMELGEEGVGALFCVFDCLGEP